jgi:NADPH-dependent 2,4-dienoyl-CoA reductase/sulfur reductase-like enzyme
MKTDRREFLKYGLITSSVFFGGIYGVRQFKTSHKRAIGYTGQWVNQSERGHQLREAIKQTPASSIKIPILIVGGGMTGLLTGYYLKRAGIANFKILEMSTSAGGNSSFGQNSVSKFPWGAHYIPLPNT